MKPLFAFAAALTLVARTSAADPDALKFGGERIGIPPLSLTESLTTRAKSPTLAPKLLPRTIPDAGKSLPHNSRSPQVSRRSGIPVIIPNEGIDYAMTIVPPDAKVDFKIVVKEPPYPAKTLPEPAK